jgi:CheY-like chemotaxis protein
MTSTSSAVAITAPPLLIVEDSDEDFAVFQRFLDRASFAIPVYRCVNGDQALAFLSQTGDYAEPSLAPRPGLIVLDLNLPGTDGREVLCQIKRNDRLKTIPVVVFTTSSNPKDIAACYQKGANSYIVKPIDFSQLKTLIPLLLEYWFTVSALPHQGYEATLL